ncbi:pyranose dehydrogenase [Cyathus striatus]|nr:pyranose dehydrogenase [Cyathus striatus]
MIILWLSVVAIILPTCYAALYQQLADLPPGKSFDFIILGGGTAGCVLANRLTEDVKTTVLIIEAGPSNEGILETMVPFFAGQLAGSKYDWATPTVAQKGLNGRVLQPYSRGRILGGGSSINGMAYTRGSADDYNRWAIVTGDIGWSWPNLLSYIFKNEKWTAPADNHNTTGQFNPTVHGFHGINLVSLPGIPATLDTRVLQAAADLKREFSYNIDMNSGNPLGVGWTRSTIGNGTRSSAATSYLGPKYIGRPNLHVVVNTRVLRVLGLSPSNKLDIRTVEVASDAESPAVKITAKKELILSSGSIGTPSILLNSGIGDKDEVEALGIPSVLHLPSVGKNLTDQPATFALWSTTVHQRTQLCSRKHWRGPLIEYIGHQIAWTQIPRNSSIFKRFPDPAAGRNTPHIEISIGGGDGPHLGGGIVLVTPTSRGSVKLNTSNPFDAPLIDPGFLTSKFDILALKEGINAGRRFYGGGTWGSYVTGEIAPTDLDDVALESFIRNSSASTAHPIGTAAMSARNAKYGVVDPDLRVKGVSGLRIVDASIMPFITCDHIQAPVCIIAERVADLIKSFWK